MAETATTGTVYPHASFRYKLEIDGLEAGGFSEVSGFDISIDVMEYRDGTMAQTPIKMPGLKKYGNITLKQGVTDAHVLYDWIIMGVDGALPRKTVTITVYDEVGDSAASWQVINAWPMKYSAPDFNASSSEVAIESIELAHEGCVRVS